MFKLAFVIATLECLPDIWHYVLEVYGYCVTSRSLWFINMLSAVSRIGRVSCYARVISLYIVLSSALLGS